MKYLLVCFLLFTCVQTRAQVNLVMNPSLEQYNNCPNAWDEIKYANYWMSLDSTWSPPDWAHDHPGVPDFCHVRAGAYNNFCGIPGSVTYTHYPHTGNGMAQVMMFASDTDVTHYVRDYLQGHLSRTLISEESYCVTFFVAAEQGSIYMINHIGAYLDDGTIDTTHNFGLPQTQCIPQVIENAILYDTVHWVRVQGSFRARGNERIITIGNFSDAEHTAAIANFDTTVIYGDTTGIFISGSGSYGWYLVDDISVIKSDAVANAGPDKIIRTATSDSVIIGDTLDTYLPCYWYSNGVVIDSNKASLKVHPDTTTRYVMGLDVCGHITYDTVVVWYGKLGLSSMQSEATATLWPNPVQDELHVADGANTILQIYDMTGREVYKTMLLSDKETLRIDFLQKGIYVVAVTDPESGYRVTKMMVKE